MGMMVWPARFAAAGAGAASSTRWRINITAKQQPASWSGITEMEMRSTIGGADQCTGGTASASADNGGSNPASNAFDNNTGTAWQSGTTSVPQQVEYQFASAKTIRQVSILPSAANDSPTAFDIQYYDGATWQTYWSDTSTLWGSNYTRVFAQYDSGTAGYLRWRLNVTATRGGGGAWAGFTEIQLRTSAGGSDVTSPLSSSYDGDFFGNTQNYQQAFDDNSGTNSLSGFAPSGGSPAQWGARFSSQKAITEIAITNTGTLGDSPKTIDVQYYDPVLASWVTSWTISDTAFSTTNETKVFTKP